MTRPRRDISCPRDPVGLTLEEAAAFVRVGPSTFLTAVEKKIMPEPRQLLGRVIWDADEVEKAFRALSKRGGASENGEGVVDWSDVAA